MMHHADGWASATSSDSHEPAARASDGSKAPYVSSSSSSSSRFIELPRSMGGVVLLVNSAQADEKATLGFSTFQSCHGSGTGARRNGRLQPRETSDGLSRSQVV